MTEFAHRARKRFGQNFLVDRSTINRLVEAIAPQSAEHVIEIGPGRGALTAALLERIAHLQAIEIDRDLVAMLRNTYAPERLTVHQADALEFDFSTLAQPLRLVGNLPYNISTPLLMRFSEHAHRLTDAHVMLQREVAQRIVADANSEHYGRLSVMLQYRFRARRLFDIPPGAFRPIPEVWSSYVRLQPRPLYELGAGDPACFAELVKAAFGQRRKTLRNALRLLLDEADLESQQIDPGARAEQLEVEQFVLLGNVLHARRRVA